jgi:hypothetical protein
VHIVRSQDPDFFCFFDAESCQRSDEAKLSAYVECSLNNVIAEDAEERLRAPLAADREELLWNRSSTKKKSHINKLVALACRRTTEGEGGDRGAKLL